MIKNLYIENYALIDKLELNFGKGFTVITGETGAGKSIIIGALSLLLGQRADNSVLFDKNKKCIVEGQFDISLLNINNIFDENDLDYDGICIIRREINDNGKSRAFINDTPVNLTILKEIGEKLIDIHSQHNTLLLNTSDFQLNVLDVFSNNKNILKEYKTEFKIYENLIKNLEILRNQDNEANTNKDYLQFQFDELEKANLIIDEQEKLEKELEVLTNAEEIKKTLYGLCYELNESEENIINRLNELNAGITKIKNFHPILNEIESRLLSCIIELKDISEEAFSFNEQIHFDNNLIEKYTERLDIIYKLQKKHKVNTVSELLEIKDDISEKLINITSLSEKIVELEKQADNQYNKIKTIAEQISNNRNKNITILEKKLIEILKDLGMNDANISINLIKLDRPNINGIDEITFLFSANKGSNMKKISEVASGGEMSRLMLAIKSVISEQNILPTVIFDEIDSGVSGDIAGKVGKIMKMMSNDRQIIAITHLPQIAAKADYHYFVSKSLKNERTISDVKELNEEEKIIEIAKMLSDEHVTNSAISAAKELKKVSNN